jgi:hypothetical protein
MVGFYLFFFVTLMHPQCWHAYRRSQRMGHGLPRPDRRVEDQDFGAASHSRLDELTGVVLDLEAQGLTWQEVAAALPGLGAPPAPAG